MTSVNQWNAEICLFCCSLKIIPGKRKFVSQGNSFDSLISLPSFIVFEIFSLNFLTSKFLESISNVTVKFRLHTTINFLIQLNYLFSLYFQTLRIIQSGDIELNPGPKSCLLSGL